jgi:hypothetical protein
VSWFVGATFVVEIEGVMEVGRVAVVGIAVVTAGGS